MGGKKRNQQSKQQQQAAAAAKNNEAVEAVADREASVTEQVPEKTEGPSVETTKPERENADCKLLFSSAI